jgi:hypothetical protein
VTERAKAARPRNQLGQPATATPAETIARLKEKVTKNHGGANRERIQAQISVELASKAEA